MIRFIPKAKFVLLMVLTGLLISCTKPDFTDSKGNGISLKDDQERWLVLNVWAEWCDPCREEIPELNAVYQSDAIRVLGYDFDNSTGKILDKKINTLGIRFPVITSSPMEILKTTTPQALPATFIINSQGQRVDTLYGPQTQNSIEQAIRRQQTKVAARD